MKKGLFLAFSLAAAVSLNAAVLASVNGKEITDNDLSPLLNNMPVAEVEKIPADTKKKIIEKVIERELMLAQANKEKIRDEAEFKKILENASDNIAVNLWMKKEFDKAKVSDSEIEKFYNQNKDKFVIPAQMKAKHILVKTEEEAKNLIKDLKDLSGENLTKKFTELAKANSIDKGSAANGGELGWFQESAMVPEFASAVAKLKKGEITKTPVKTNFGYHIILKEDSKNKATIALKDIKPDITNQLKAEKAQVAIQKRVSDLKKEAKIEYKIQ